MNKLKNVLDLGLRVISKKATKKQDDEHRKISEDNKRKFMELWEEKYSKDIKSRKPLDFFEDDRNHDKGL